jgi:hypothetical protein
MTGREQAIAAAAKDYAAALDRRDAQAPDEAAQVADDWQQGHPLTLTQIRDLITRERDAAARERGGKQAA